MGNKGSTRRGLFRKPRWQNVAHDPPALVDLESFDEETEEEEEEENVTENGGGSDADDEGNDEGWNNRVCFATTRNGTRCRSKPSED